MKHIASMQRKYCLIGYPLEHSISPEIHRRLFEISGIEGEYSLYELAPEGFGAGVGRLAALDGFNITIPYKQRIIPYLASVDERASRYGAVNTVKCGADGMHGFNTDAEGFLRAIGQAGIRLSGKILICGAGGVSRMMAHEALERGCSLVIATPTFSEASKCVDELRAFFPNADITPSTLAYLSGSFDVILNGTPCGMYPHPNECPVPVQVARCAGAVFDAIYNPLETQLMARARATGANVLGGLTMLVWQAAAAQEIWNGYRFKPEQIEPLCEEMAILLKYRFEA